MRKTLIFQEKYPIFSPKIMSTALTREQGEQTSLRKNRTKFSQTHFFVKINT
jgi:hypothetical protein